MAPNKKHRGKPGEADKKQHNDKKQRKEKDLNQPKSEPRTIENTRVPVEVLSSDTTFDEAFSSFFVDGGDPRIVVTTNRRACPASYEFAEELSDLFPTAEFRKRAAAHLLTDIVSEAHELGYTHVVVVNESRKMPHTLSVVKLPAGPTAVFKLSSVRLSKQIHNHGRSSSHTPELILNNLSTRLGVVVGRLFVSLFPHVPQFTGRQVVTFHNQRDFIFVRRHRYIFENGQRVRMQELGPQFTLKLRALYKAVHGFKDAEPEWVWRPHAVDSKQAVL